MMAARHRVSHLITELHTGGAQKALARLLRTAGRENYDFSVFCLYGGSGQVAREIHSLGIGVTDLGMTGKWRVDALWRLFWGLRCQRPAVLHTWMYHANVVGRVIGRLAGVPVIVSSRRNENIGGVLRECINRWTMPLCDHSLAVSEAVRAVEIERARVRPERVTAIPNGLDPQEWSLADPSVRSSVRDRLGVPPEAILLGCVSRLHPQKGLGFLLEATVKVHATWPTSRLLLVGEGELCDTLGLQAQRLGLEDVVTLTGECNDVAGILQALDLFVLPSLWEGMPNAVLEAMAAGLPVVATAVGGTPELVVDGETGILVPPGQPDALGDAILRMLEDPAMRARMGDSGQRRVREHFTIERTAREIERVYRVLLARHKLLATEGVIDG